MYTEEIAPLRLRDAFYGVSKLLQISGWWPWEDDNGNAVLKFLYVNIYRWFSRISFTFFNIGTQVIAAVVASDDGLERFATASFMALTHLNLVLKLLSFNYYHRDVLALIDSLDKRPSYTPKIKRHREIIVSYMRHASRAAIVSTGIFVIGLIFNGILPIIEYWARGSPVHLPLDMWYPFRTDYSPLFQFMYLFQVVAVCINASSNGAIDFLYAIFMAHICAQLDVLSDNLENIVVYTKRAIQVDYDHIDQVDEVLQRELDRNLARCVLHHRDIIELRDEVSRLFFNNITMQFGFGVVVVCISMFLASMLGMDDMGFYYTIYYTLTILVEIMSYFYYSNECILRSDKLSYAAFSSNWYSCSNSYKKKLLFFMQCTKNPIKMYAGGFFVLSFEIYVSILRSSWSFYALLRSVNDG